MLTKLTTCYKLMSGFLMLFHLHQHIWWILNPLTVIMCHVVNLLLTWVGRQSSEIV